MHFFLKGRRKAIGVWCMFFVDKGAIDNMNRLYPCALCVLRSCIGRSY